MDRYLDRLITRLQKKYEDLDLEMKSCIQESDFITAAALSNPLKVIAAKLNALYLAKNPNFREIQKFEIQIEKYSELIRSKPSGSDLSGKLRPYHIERLKSELAEAKSNLSKLKNIKEQAFVNDDKLLDHIELVINGEISKIDLPFTNFVMSLSFEKTSNNIFLLKLFTLDHYTMDDHLHYVRKLFVSDLGFKPIDDYYTLEIHTDIITPNQVLEIISILCFQVFNITGTIEMKLD
ncbi:MAG: hypothetical protein ACJA1A_003015 [Saprospiraceae bacterium]|jgi:hypothetical protein